VGDVGDVGRFHDVSVLKCKAMFDCTVKPTTGYRLPAHHVRATTQTNSTIAIYDKPVN
jgi:hypothetical protein